MYWRFENVTPNFKYLMEGKNRFQIPDEVENATVRKGRFFEINKEAVQKILTVVPTRKSQNSPE